MNLIDIIEESGLSIAEYCKVLACIHVTYSEIDRYAENPLDQIDPKKHRMLVTFDDSLNIVLSSIGEKIFDSDIPYYIANLTKVSPKVERMIFINVLDFILSDKQISNEEKDVIDRFINAFVIEEDELDSILKVMKWKYNL